MNNIFTGFSKRIKGSKLNRKFTLIIVALVLIPTAAFTYILFANMEQNSIKENSQSLEYALNRSEDEIAKNIENIDISTEFFLGDESLLEYLERVRNEEKISLKERREFNSNTVSVLERIVNSNPMINQIRVYVDNQDMNELTPILYSYESMKQLDWAEDEELLGWKFSPHDYDDRKISLINRYKQISLIKSITDSAQKEMALIEIVISMDMMFPEIFEPEKDISLFFKKDDGYIYCTGETQNKVDYFDELLDDIEGHISTKEDFSSQYLQIKGEHYLVAGRYVGELGGTVVAIYDLNDSIGALHENRNGFLLVMVLLFILLILFINAVVKGLFAEFYKVMGSIREIQNGNLDVRISKYSNDEMGELGEQINKMMDTIRHLMEDNLNRERLAKNSEIRALQNQINAHFIYNVLESIKMMAEIDEKYDISDAITALGKLLRYSMHWTSGNVTVNEELDYIKNYLALINLRFDYEIYLSLNLPEIILHQEIPKMSLQPIVENAIYHGIEQLAEDTNIYVKGTLEDGDVIIEVTDAGKGMSNEQVEELYRRINGELDSDEINPEGKGNGIGLKNVQDRIRMNFGEKYGLSINSKLGCFTKVEIRVPQTYFEKR